MVKRSKHKRYDCFSKKDWTKQKHKISEIKSIELYVKPEDYAVYYVINGEHTGKVWL